MFVQSASTCTTLIRCSFRICLPNVRSFCLANGVAQLPERSNSPARPARVNLSVASTLPGSQPDEGNSALRYLWARSRIAELSDYGTSDVTEESVKEITALGLKYNLLTRYTSFIAVREVVSNPTGSADDVKQPLPLPMR